MKKTLIFGINGFVGKYLAKEFLANGYEIYGSSRIGETVSQEYTSSYVCDLLDADQVKNVISEVNPDIIINLAGRSSVGISWRIPRNTVEVNVCGALNILEAVRSCDMDCRILMVGSSEEYDSIEGALREEALLYANNPYGISKMMLELFSTVYRERYGMSIYFVRAFNHTGIGQTDSFVIPSWCKQAAVISESGSKGEMLVGNLDIVRDFSNVRDVCRAYRMIVESDDCSVIYNVGSGTPVPLREVLEYIISLSKQPIEVKVNPKLIRPTENPAIYCDRSLLTERLGWEPEIDIFETVKEIFEYYVEKERERKQKANNGR